MRFLPSRRQLVLEAEGVTYLGIVILAGILITVGVAMALTQPDKLEAEGGSLSHGAEVASNDLASGGKYVVLKSTNTSTSAGAGSSGGTSSGSSAGTAAQGGSAGGQPSTGGGSTGGGGTISSDWPAAHNTGYPHGLPGDTRTAVTLSPYAGPCTINTPGTVIDSKDITCRLNIRTTGVVIKNSRVRVANDTAIHVNDEYHVVVMDTELDGQRLDNSAGGISLIGDGSYTLIRVDAHSSGDIARANWGNVQILDSWLHDPYCLQASCHNDVIQTTDGDCSTINATYPYCIWIKHNRLENPNNQTSNILLKADQGSIHDVMVEDNLFNGGGYTFYWYDANFQISNGTVRNNRFKRAPDGYWPNGGSFGPVASNVSDQSRWPTWTNNVWHDDGSVISF